VFWNSDSQALLGRLPVAGGAETLLTGTSTAVAGIALDATNVYLTFDDKVVKVSK
jgi:hypothetical protein